MKKPLLIIVVFCVLLTCTPNQTFAASPDSCLEENLALDFSKTQFSFTDPIGLWFVFKFKATNIGTKNLRIMFNKYCIENPGRIPVGSPQGNTILAPGESMWFKMILSSDELGYDPNTPQTVSRTLYMEFVDNNNNWEYPDNMFSVTKTIQIKVVNRPLMEGSVIIQGTTVDEEGTPIPYAEVNLGGYGANVPRTSDATGHFSYSIVESPVYFLIAQKEGYRATYIEIDGSNVQQSYAVTLTREQLDVSINATLMNTVTGNIGFWRCAATADESKLLLVNGMENWEDESIKSQSKLYLLNTNTGEILWTHDMGWESWSADITDDGKYAVFATKLEGFQTGPPGFVNYIRLLNGTDGSTIWEKKVTPENFPATTQGDFYSRGVKFSHDGNYILVYVHDECAYLLNREDGSIKWHTLVSAEVREIIFTKDNQYVYVPSSGGWLYKVRMSDGSKVWKQWIGCWPYVNGFDISSNEEYIAVGTKAAYLTVISTSDGTVKFTRDINSGKAICRFSPDGTKILVGGNVLTMFDLNGNVLWRVYKTASDIRFSSDGKLVFTDNGAVFDINGTVRYDILPGWDRSSKVGWINSDATRYIFAVQDTNSIEATNVIEVYLLETSIEEIPEFSSWSLFLFTLVALSAALCIMKKHMQT